MPFPVDPRFIEEAEAALGARLPDAWRHRLARENGGELEVAPDCWFLHPVRDTSDRKRLKRTCNDIARETRYARSRTGFPQDAVAIGENGGGDCLVLLPSAGDPSVLSATLHWWDHETGDVHPIGDLDEVL